MIRLTLAEARSIETILLNDGLHEETCAAVDPDTDSPQPWSELEDESVCDCNLGLALAAIGSIRVAANQLSGKEK